MSTEDPDHCSFCGESLGSGFTVWRDEGGVWIFCDGHCAAGWLKKRDLIAALFDLEHRQAPSEEF